MPAVPSFKPWNEDDPRDLPIIEQRLRDLLGRLVSEAPLRVPPSVDMARAWHLEVHEGLHLPAPYYAGEVRDSNPQFPFLYGYEVKIGNALGTPSARVPDELNDFETGIRRLTDTLDGQLSVGERPGNPVLLRAVIRLCAMAHGEWIRIHPFANGNGRTARLWANWCALRYELPPFVRLRPRPDHPDYGAASAVSMARYHVPMEQVFIDMLLTPPTTRP